MKKAIFPGTFDPFTLGHLDILNRSTLIFDEIIIGIGINRDKKTMFNIDQRIEMIESIIKDNPKVSVQSYDGLTIDFCKKVGANFIVRGVRNTGDFEFEKAITIYAKQKQFNGVICGHIHTPEIKKVDETFYYNCGDWVESHTALVENHDGTFEIINWADIASNNEFEEKKNKIISQEEKKTRVKKSTKQKSRRQKMNK